MPSAEVGLNALAAIAFPDQTKDSIPKGTSIGELLGTTLTDPDAASKKGIALFAISGLGTWQYSLNGRKWLDVGSVSAESALLLAEKPKLRFVPATDWTGSAFIQYRSWDQTVGLTGERADVSSDNQNAFGLAHEVATVTVTPVNDRPLLDNAGTPTLAALAGTETDPTGTSVSTLRSPRIPPPSRRQGTIA